MANVGEWNFCVCAKNEIMALRYTVMLYQDNFFWYITCFLSILFQRFTKDIAKKCGKIKLSNVVRFHFLVC